MTFLPSAVILSDAARGLAQQMVFWGHDVRHPDGNALVRFGLNRSPSSGLTDTSCYQMPWENGVIELHGAVASWTPPHGGMGSVFCRDLARVDLWNETQPPVPGRQRGKSGSIEERWQALQPFLRWLISYETWVSQTLSDSWRTNCCGRHQETAKRQTLAASAPRPEMVGTRRRR